MTLKNKLLQALLQEVDIRAGAFAAQTGRDYLEGEKVDTIYIGGGTPSLLTANELGTVLTKLHASFPVVPGAEITLEANPDDISGTKLQEWKQAGINRLSIGVQSFFDSELRWMNRAHTSIQSIEAIRAAQQAGFSNITIDLIYGTPGLSNEQWERNIAQAVDLSIPHLSCYALTVEPATALSHLIEKGRSKDVNPEKQAAQFLLLAGALEAAGYEQYEISNFARPGMRSRHNAAYWQGKHYIGLGPSAHSFNGSSRQWNIANNALYISSLQKGVLPAETEQLTPTQQLNEYIMTSLRTTEGLDLIHVDQLFGTNAVEHIRKGIRKYQHNGKVEEQQGMLRLTLEGKLFADGIAADLFVLNQDARD